jgi:hypothetical protein
LAYFGIVPAVFLELVSSDIGVEALLNSENAILRWVFIVFDALKTCIPGVITQIFDHYLNNVISIRNHGNGYFEIVLLGLIVDRFYLE